MGFAALSTNLPTPSIGTVFSAEFLAFEMASTGVFAIEYALRIWVCVEQERLRAPVTGRPRYALQPLPLIDLLVIATYWTPLDLRFLRVFRLVRLLKVLRLYEFEATLHHLGAALRRRRRREMLIVSIVLMLVCVYAASAVLYQVEHKQQPQVFSSIPATFWWAVATFTTIGYGDMAPVTAIGKLFASLIAVFGIGVFALPTAIVTAAIIEASAGPQAGEAPQHHTLP